MAFHNIYLNQPTREIDAAYTYKSDKQLKIGTLVKVPFRNRSVGGIVKEAIGTLKIPANKVLPIKKVVSSTPAVDESAFILARYLSRHYITSMGEVLNAIAPIIKHAEDTVGTVAYRRYPDATPIRFIEGSLAKRLVVYATEIQKLKNKRQQILLIFPTRRLVRLAAEYLSPILGDHAVKNVEAKSSHDIISAPPAVVIGTRKTIFYPASKLGLIIVDQPNHFGFFNDQKPPYTVRDASLAIHELYNTPLIWGDHTINTDALWQAKHQQLTISGDARQRKTDLVWLEGPFRPSREESALTLVLVPFAAGMPLICPHCGTNAYCSICSAPLLARNDIHAICRNGHQNPLAPCNRCHNIYPVSSHLTPETVAETVKNQLPQENIIILRREQRDIAIPRQRPLTVVGTPKALDYPELSFDKIFILSAERWLSMPRPDAVTHLVRTIWQLRSQARHELIIQSNRSLPQLQYLLNRKPSEVLLAEMKRYHQLQLPPFTRKVEFHTSKPSAVARILKPLAVRTLIDTDIVTAYVPRDHWPLPENIATQMYRVVDKVTVDKP